MHPDGLAVHWGRARANHRVGRVRAHRGKLLAPVRRRRRLPDTVALRKLVRIVGEKASGVGEIPLRRQPEAPFVPRDEGVAVWVVEPRAAVAVRVVVALVVAYLPGLLAVEPKDIPIEPEAVKCKKVARQLS